MKTPTMAVQADHGRWFAVRYLPVGARYGHIHSLTVGEGDGALVEFWDLTVADDARSPHVGFGSLGQFVSRYRVAELIDVVSAAGLCLDGGNRDVWSIDAASMKVVRSWLRRTRAELQRSLARS